MIFFTIITIISKIFPITILIKYYSKAKSYQKKINYFKLFENNNLILNDEKGNIIVYSVIENIKIDEFNFYKKKFKR